MKKMLRAFSVAGVGSICAMQLLSGCAMDMADEAENVAEHQEALLCGGPYPSRVTASANAKQTAANAIDGNPQTRWESAWADNQVITVELAQQMNIAGVTLNWEAACGKDYDIDYQGFAGGPWMNLVKVRGNTKSGVVTHPVTTYKAKFVRLTGITRCLPQYGFSLWEFGVNVASTKCYTDGDLDGYGKPGTLTESCNACTSGRANNDRDCYDSNKYANPFATSYSKTNRGDGSFDWNCDGTTEVRSQTGNVSFVCTDYVTHKKTSDCSRCEYNFVAIDKTDCGQLRCSASASEYILCR